MSQFPIITVFWSSYITADRYEALYKVCRVEDQVKSHPMMQFCRGRQFKLHKTGFLAEREGGPSQLSFRPQSTHTKQFSTGQKKLKRAVESPLLLFCFFSPYIVRYCDNVGNDKSGTNVICNHIQPFYCPCGLIIVC